MSKLLFGGLGLGPLSPFDGSSMHTKSVWISSSKSAVYVPIVSVLESLLLTGCLFKHCGKRQIIGLISISAGLRVFLGHLPKSSTYLGVRLGPCCKARAFQIWPYRKGCTKKA